MTTEATTGVVTITAKTKVIIASIPKKDKKKDNRIIIITTEEEESAAARARGLVHKANSEE